MTTAVRTAVAAGEYSLDVRDALASLPDPVSLFVRDSCVVKLSDDHYVVVSPDDARGSDWATDVIPAGDEWGVSFESVGPALLRHFTRP